MQNDTEISQHNRTKRYINAFGRFEGYKELLANCDVVIAIGGTEGVYRMGLFTADKDTIFLPFSFAGGRAKTLVRELQSLLVGYGEDLLPILSQETELGEQDIEQLLHIMNDAIKLKKEKAIQSNQKRNHTKTITQAEAVDFLIHSDVEKLPLGVLIRVLPPKTTLWVLSTLVGLMVITATVTWNVAKYLNENKHDSISAQSQIIDQKKNSNANKTKN